jgi:hypothetical protein
VDGTTQQIYFSDFFEVAPALLQEHGAFDISLITDLPLFIDPFLLFNSSKVEYRALHEQMIAYVRFLRDKSVQEEISNGLLKSWFMFSEVKQNWLGYAKRGNRGSGLGRQFAEALRLNLNTVFNGFGGENVTRSSHIEKLCLFRSGVGRDNISDFTTNLIKHFLLEYTENFTKRYLRPDQVQTVVHPPKLDTEGLDFS